MPGVTTEVALLPISAVLFPGTYLPLHIDGVDERRLVRECVDAGRRMGVVYAPGKTTPGRVTVPCTMGCLATVSLFTQEGEHEDEVHVVLYGERRMRVMGFTQQIPYLAGQVEVLDDCAGPHADRRAREATDAYRQYNDLMRARYNPDLLDVPVPDDPSAASYMLASVLHQPFESKQRWLESATASQRLCEQLVYLRSECEKLAVLHAIAQKQAHNYLQPDPNVYFALTSPN